MIVPYSHILALAGIVFLLGMVCAVSRQNLIMILLGLEVMLNAAALALVGASLRWMATDGQAMALFVIVVAAAEVSVGLALIVCVHRRTGSVDPALEEPAAPENPGA
ncbi:MAG: NADH-quinone oxidoreductase subunit NuoK [Desulfobacterales bacterium]|jgi:NADH-quinone oxidoreductase subunit K